VAEGAPGAGAVTVGGMVVSRLGRVPAPGEEVTVDGFLFRVLESDGRAVRTVAVERRDPVEEDAPGLRRH